jgi:hypothetical protein
MGEEYRRKVVAERKLQKTVSIWLGYPLPFIDQSAPRVQRSEQHILHSLTRRKRGLKIRLHFWKGTLLCRRKRFHV